MQRFDQSPSRGERRRSPFQGRKYRHRPTPEQTPPTRPFALVWRFSQIMLGILVTWVRSSLLSLTDRRPGAPVRRVRLWKQLLERLGGVFVKFGQFLSVRTDVFPWEVCREFATLLDSARPFPLRTVVETLEHELRAPLHEVFSHFDETPLAAASIGQVHVAWLRADGKKVAVKVQRPNVARDVQIDVRILLFMTRVVDLLHLNGGVAQTPMGREIAAIMMEELSYLNEARCADEFRKSIKKRKRILAPRIYMDYTTDRVLMMEFIDGLTLSTLIKAIENREERALERFRLAGIDRDVIARRFYEAVLRQLLEHTVNHGDPHPGNILICPNNAVCFVDFGAIAHFGATFREKVWQVMQALGREDAEAAAEATIASWEPLPPQNVDDFKREITPVFQTKLNHGRSKLGDPNLKSNGRAYSDIARIGRKYGITAPWDQLRFSRILWELETTVITLNPDFNFSKQIRRYFKARTRRQLRANARPEQRAIRSATVKRILADLPADIETIRHQILRGMRQGENFFVHSISKAANAGRMLLQHFMLAFTGAALALPTLRIILGADVVDDWLARHLPFAVPWWLATLLALYATQALYRIYANLGHIDTRDR